MSARSASPCDKRNSQIAKRLNSRSPTIHLNPSSDVVNRSTSRTLPIALEVAYSHSVSNMPSQNTGRHPFDDLGTS